MAKFRIEFCLISARGLRRSSSLWKLQWFAVGWVDPNTKYCTKIDTSGTTNPTWKTKFSALINDSETDLQTMALQVQVYSREPIFLREKLEGTATVLLKEFLAKYMMNSKALEEVGSFQLRKKGSGKPLGFVDVSIRISEDTDYPAGNEQGFNLAAGDHGNGMPLAVGNGSSGPLPLPHNQTQNYSQMGPLYPNPTPIPINHYNPSVSYRPPSTPPPPPPHYNPSVSYRPPRTPPPPPPPSHVGYLPTFLPRNDQLSGGTYVNMPSSGSGTGPGRTTGGPGFGVGMGAGALAAGAMIFGDDFMSGFELPSGLQDASLTISTDPPF